jgi:hypothetical protein
LVAAVEEIRRLPGYGDFLAAAGFAEVATASKRQPVVYLAATAETGIALVVTGPGVVPVPLPALTDEAVQGAVADYATAYEAWRGDPDGGAEQEWTECLDRVCRWLWEAIFEPLRGALRRLSRATLIPCGPLGALPLHAAWRPDEGARTGRRYAMDEMTLSYAPSGRALRAAAEVAAEVPAARLLAVVDPRPVSAAPLPGAAWEVAVARRVFPDADVFEAEAATLEDVREALSRASVLHFAGHGVSSLTDPLDSALVLAGDRPLALREIFGLRLGLRLVVLSACETAVAGRTLPDEVVSLPTGILQAGAAGVVASQWVVRDVPAAMLVAEFYRLWRRLSLTPAEALHRAQQWLRDTTNEQKARYYAEARRSDGDWLTPQAAEALHASVVWAEPKERAHAAIGTWGGFAHIGV